VWGVVYCARTRKDSHRSERALSLLWQAQVETVLRALLNSADAEARAHAEKIADLLVQNGSLFARDLLSNRMAK
jgi:hypothetical protein